MPKLTVKFPLEESGTNPGYDLISNDEINELVKFNIKNTLLTCPGERTFDHEDFGACLRELLFEFPTEGLLGKAQSRIQSQLSYFVPYITLEDIQVTNPEEMVMNIKLFYVINEIEVRDELEILVEV